MFNKIYIVRKLNAETAPQVSTVCRIIITTAEKSNIPVISNDMYFDRDKIDKETLIIAVGGDGTMLEAMRLAAIKGAIATGINLGQVGFLTDFAYDKYNNNLRDALEFLFNNQEQHLIEKRMSIAVRPSKANNIASEPVFNEFVLSNLYSDHIITYNLQIDGIDAGRHRANGIIVGTPTGSTAYMLSNGGSLIYPSMNVIQIVPVAPLSMSSRPIIVPGTSVVKLRIETEGTWVLKGDGVKLNQFGKKELISDPITIGPAIEITKFNKDTRILHPPGWNFFDMLTNKLHWKKS